MSAKISHTVGDSCALCSLKLDEAHPDLRTWYSQIKKKFNDCHVSWSFRDKVSQNEAYAEGKSKASWPNSKHNIMNDGVPCAQALDLFQIASNGMACWVYSYFKKIKDESGPDIKWGGDFKDKTLGDYDHFELIL